MDLRIADVYFNRCNTSENEIELGQSSRRGNVSQVNETQTLSKKTISGQNLSNRWNTESYKYIFQIYFCIFSSLNKSWSSKNTYF